MLEDLLIPVSFLGNLFIRCGDSLESTDGTGKLKIILSRVGWIHPPKILYRGG